MIPPRLRLSAALALMSVSLVLLAALLGLFPDPNRAALQRRAHTLDLVSFSIREYARARDLAPLRAYVRLAVAGSDDLRGIYVRNAAGELITVSGNIDPDRKPDPAATDFVIASIGGDGEQWGEIGFAFSPLPAGGLDAVVHSPLLRLALFIGFGGFGLYSLYLRRVLGAIDPTAVMPERVRTVMNALVEGVVLVDHRQRIVMGNRTFARNLDVNVHELPGKLLSSFPWRRPEHADPAKPYPWEMAFDSAVTQIDNVLILTTDRHGRRYYSVNVTPILDDKHAVKGALATFDDQTDVIEKNDTLHNALSILEQQRKEISAQNEELKNLATRDPLTGCLNRRAFLEIFEAELIAAQKRAYPLACIMCDIDHFKSINDTYGHSMGDRVIQQMAKALQAAVRENDHICRYGGEEFCVLLPGITMVEAGTVAERIRTNLETQGAARLRLTGDRTITASFGATDLTGGAASLSELIDQADAALYQSKESGRNRVSLYDPTKASAPKRPEAKRSSGP